MTEAEAPAQIERLKRIWVPKHETDFCLEFIGIHNVVGAENFIFGYIELEDGKDGLEIWFGRSDCRLEQVSDPEHITLITCNTFTGEIEFSPELHSQTNRRFISEWLPYFRRNCWLSGAPIECTAHEKLEWIQGFSPQEIEAWNLQF